MGQNREGKRGRRESSVVHQCDQCGRRCFGKKNLVIHKATSHGTPPQKTIYCCLGRAQDGSPCGEKDEDLATMKRHVMINHIKIDPYICKLCNPGAVLSVGLGDKHLHKQHGSFCTRENAHRHLLQQRSHECIADMRRRLDPSQWRIFAAQVKKELCGVVSVSDDLKQRLIGDENSSCNVCQLELGSPEALRSHFEARVSCEMRFACPYCSHDLLGPEQLLEHVTSKHKDLELVEPRACLTKKLVWLKRPRQRPAKTADEQPLDLSVTAASGAAVKDESVINDSGCPLTPAAKDVTPLLNPFINAWASPAALWSGLLSWPFRYPTHLLPPPPATAAFASHQAAIETTPSDIVISTPMPPAAADVGAASSDFSAAAAASAAAATAESQRRLSQRRADDAEAATAASACGGGSGGGASNSDSEGDAGPLKKKAKKNSYKDAPNLIFCPFSNCKQSFPWMSSLKRHIITHTSHKPYCCTRCTQSFSTKSNRERHMERIHHIKVKGNHAFLSSDELTTFFEHDKVAEKIGEELLNQLGNSVVTSVNPHRLAQRADGEHQDLDNKDSLLSVSPSGCSGNQSSLILSPPTSASASAASAANATAGSVFKCPECPFASAGRRDALEHLRVEHRDVWQLVAARSRLATVDAVMAGGAAAPCSEDEEADDDDNAEGQDAAVDEDGDDDDTAALVTTDADDDDDEDGSRSTTPGGAPRRRLLCPVCSARLWSPRHLRRHMRGHTGSKPHRCRVCDRAFRLSHSLRRHLRSRHPHTVAAAVAAAAAAAANDAGASTVTFGGGGVINGEQLFQPWLPQQHPQDSPINLRVADATPSASAVSP